MRANPATLSLAQLSPRADACELCGSSPETLRTAVLLRHTRGASVQFSICDRCASAIRRLIAVAGAPTSSGPAHLVLDAQAASATTPTVEPSAPDMVGEPVLVHAFADAFQAQDGTLYTVHAYGQPRADGTWIGWLAFIGADGMTTRRTPRETTQSNREHLAYWATGLQPSFLEGSFSRAG